MLRGEIPQSCATMSTHILQTFLSADANSGVSTTWCQVGISSKMISGHPSVVAD